METEEQIEAKKGPKKRQTRTWKLIETTTNKECPTHQSAVELVPPPQQEKSNTHQIEKKISDDHDENKINKNIPNNQINNQTKQR